MNWGVSTDRLAQRLSSVAQRWVVDGPAERSERSRRALLGAIAEREPSTLNEVAAAVGLHARLLEQPPVGAELTFGWIGRAGEFDVALERPALGVLAVEGLVQRHAEGAQHVAARDLLGEQRLARAEQLVGVEVDPARVRLDVAGV